jgi:HEAT repeat protein
MIQKLKRILYLNQLNSKNPDRSGKACWALAKIADERDFITFVELLEHSNFNMSHNAALALGNIGDSRAINPLIRMLGHDLIYPYAVSSLSKLGELKWANLVKDLEMADQNFTRLAESDDPRAFEPIMEALKPKYYPEHRARAAWSLEKIKIKDARMVDILIASLIQTPGDKKNLVPGAAAFILGDLGDNRAVEPLIKVLNEPTYLNACCTAAISLGKLGAKQAVESLIGVITAPDVGIFNYACLLHKIFEDRVIVRSSIKVFMRECIIALGNIGDQRAIEPIINFLAYPEKEVRGEAAKALVKLDEFRWTDLVKGDNGDYDRLVQSSDPRAIDALIKSQSIPHGLNQSLWIHHYDDENDDQERKNAIARLITN